jgi:hypothetical protein
MGNSISSDVIKDGGSYKEWENINSKDYYNKKVDLKKLPKLNNLSNVLMHHDSYSFKGKLEDSQHFLDCFGNYETRSFNSASSVQGTIDEYFIMKKIYEKQITNDTKQTSTLLCLFESIKSQLIIHKKSFEIKNNKSNSNISNDSQLDCYELCIRNLADNGDTINNNCTSSYQIGLSSMKKVADNNNNNSKNFEKSNLNDLLISSSIGLSALAIESFANSPQYEGAVKEMFQILTAILIKSDENFDIKIVKNEQENGLFEFEINNKLKIIKGDAGLFHNISIDSPKFISYDKIIDISNKYLDKTLDDDQVEHGDLAISLLFSIHTVKRSLVGLIAVVQCLNNGTRKLLSSVETLFYKLIGNSDNSFNNLTGKEQAKLILNSLTRSCLLEQLSFVSAHSKTDCINAFSLLHDFIEAESVATLASTNLTGQSSDDVSYGSNNSLLVHDLLLILSRNIELFSIINADNDCDNIFSSGNEINKDIKPSIVGEWTGVATSLSSCEDSIPINVTIYSEDGGGIIEYSSLDMTSTLEMVMGDDKQCLYIENKVVSDQVRSKYKVAVQLHNGSLCYTSGKSVDHICCYHFQKGDSLWSCSTCQTDRSCVMCDSCYRDSNHIGHNVNQHISSGGGYCDCGDFSSISTTGCCSKHNCTDNKKNADNDYFAILDRISKSPKNSSKSSILSIKDFKSKIKTLLIGLLNQNFRKENIHASILSCLVKNIDFFIPDVTDQFKFWLKLLVENNINFIKVCESSSSSSSTIHPSSNSISGFIFCHSLFVKFNIDKEKLHELILTCMQQNNNTGFMSIYELFDNILLSYDCLYKFILDKNNKCNNLSKEIYNKMYEAIDSFIMLLYGIYLGYDDQDKSSLNIGTINMDFFKIHFKLTDSVLKQLNSLELYINTSTIDEVNEILKMELSNSYALSLSLTTIKTIIFYNFSDISNKLIIEISNRIDNLEVGVISLQQSIKTINGCNFSLDWLDLFINTIIQTKIVIMNYMISFKPPVITDVTIDNTTLGWLKCPLLSMKKSQNETIQDSDNDNTLNSSEMKELNDLGLNVGPVSSEDDKDLVINKILVGLSNKETLDDVNSLSRSLVNLAKKHVRCDQGNNINTMTYATCSALLWHFELSDEIYDLTSNNANKSIVPSKIFIDIWKLGYQKINEHLRNNSNNDENINNEEYNKIIQRSQLLLDFTPISYSSVDFNLGNWKVLSGELIRQSSSLKQKSNNSSNILSPKSSSNNLSNSFNLVAPSSPSREKTKAKNSISNSFGESIIDFILHGPDPTTIIKLLNLRDISGNLRIKGFSIGYDLYSRISFINESYDDNINGNKSGKLNFLENNMKIKPIENIYQWLPNQIALSYHKGIETYSEDGIHYLSNLNGISMEVKQDLCTIHKNMLELVILKARNVIKNFNINDTNQIITIMTTLSLLSQDYQAVDSGMLINLHIDEFILECFLLNVIEINKVSLKLMELIAFRCCTSRKSQQEFGNEIPGKIK